MAKARDKIAMSEEEMAAFMDGCKSLNVATLGKDGAPHLTTLWFARHDGEVLFETYGKSQKVINLQRDPRIAILCEAGVEYNDLRGVSIRGKGEVVDQAPRLLELMTVLVRRNHPELSEDQAVAQATAMAAKRVVIVVHPEKTMSWDHRKLAAIAH
jgi:PPOX class probable F420-dependent enzyme